MSTAFSKFFKEHIKPRNCQNLLHTDGCLEHVIKDCLPYFISNAKYFAPVCMETITNSPQLENRMQETKETHPLFLLFTNGGDIDRFLLIANDTDIDAELRKDSARYGSASFATMEQKHQSNNVRKRSVLYSKEITYRIFLPSFIMFSCYRQNLPILVDLQKINKKKLRKTLEYYLGCSICGWLVGYSINVFMCIIRNIVRRFYFYTFTFIPGMLGGSLVYLGPARVFNLFEITIFQCTIESFFVMRRNFISRAIADSRVLQTGLFMLCSAIILFGKQIYNTKGFWILTPNSKLTPSENTEDQKCKLHPQTTCQQYLFDGMSKYFILGLTMDLIKMLTRKKVTSQVQTKFIGKLRNFRIHSMPLLTGYIGIYRFIHCWLNHKGFYPDLCNHIVSSFFAGSIFYYYPQATLLSYALVQAIRSLWSIFEAANQNATNKILKFILKIPCGRLLYPLCLGHLLNLSVLQPKYTSPLTVTVVNNIANNYPKHIGNEIDKIKRRYNNK